MSHHRKHISPIHDHLQELLQMRQKLQGGRDVSYMLHQLFRDLLMINDPDSSQWPSFREKLDQGGKLAECLYHELQSEKPEAARDEEELPLEARFCRPEEEAETAKEVLRDTVDERYLAPPSLPDLPGSLGPGRSGDFLFDDYKLDLAVDEAQSPEAAAGEEELPLEARFCRPEEEAESVKEVLRDSMEERYLAPSSLPDLPGSLRPGRSGGFLFDDYKLDLAVDEAPPSCDAYHPGPLIGHMSHPISYMQGLQLQLTPSPLVNNCLQLQLQRQWDSGDYRPRFSPVSTIWSFTANTESANKWSSVQGMKTSPKLECDSLENPAANNHGCQVIGHTDATSALKEKILKRKLLLSKRKLACRFPGLHAQTERSHSCHFWELKYHQPQKRLQGKGYVADKPANPMLPRAGLSSEVGIEESGAPFGMGPIVNSQGPVTHRTLDVPFSGATRPLLPVASHGQAASGRPLLRATGGGGRPSSRALSAAPGRAPQPPAPSSSLPSPAPCSEPGALRAPSGRLGAAPARVPSPPGAPSPRRSQRPGRAGLEAPSAGRPYSPRPRPRPQRRALRDTGAAASARGPQPAPPAPPAAGPARPPPPPGPSPSPAPPGGRGRSRGRRAIQRPRDAPPALPRPLELGWGPRSRSGSGRRGAGPAQERGAGL
ncbi:NBPF family member NBPF4-like [Dasypus novemcinctus]|uniref:NBPF family member NBPF4-like n=1 Tax=Dasypus novemcinctus TaxID=9361 RepID=UPI0039C98F28